MFDLSAHQNNCLSNRVELSSKEKLSFNLFCKNSPEGCAPLRAPGGGGEPPVAPLLPLLLARADGRQPPATPTTMNNSVCRCAGLLGPHHEMGSSR